MSLKQKCSAAQALALQYLQSQQAADGSFVSFSSPQQQPFTTNKKYQTTFVPSLMLGSLSAIDLAPTKSIRLKLADYLRRQASAHGSYNYWSRQSKEYSKQPYPDDLDDTFCALSSLYLHDARLVNQSAIAAAVKLLLATETTVGGPYRTWLIDASADAVWQDVDVAVNANINYFLSLVSEPLPNLIRFIDQAIITDTLKSPYYPSAYPLLYYISRNYSGQHKTRLIKKARNLLATATTSLEQTLCMCALLRLGSSVETAHVEKLLAQQSADGSWPAAAFCIDPDRNDKKHFNGCASLTTAFVLEVLNLYGERLSTKSGHRLAEEIENSLDRQVANDVKDLQPAFADSITNATKKIVQGSNGPEIYHLPRAFNESLLKPLPNNLKTKQLLATLSLANTYGWLAYTIYDDFLDEEGRPEMLAIANFAHRQSLTSFSDVIHPKTIVNDAFNTIDAANEWEVQHCRYKVTAKNITIGSLPDYGVLEQLANRSLGHTLAPLAILLAVGHSTTSIAWKQTKVALKHYLIARQLNDDLHDWQQDLQKGQISYVVARVLKDLKLKPGTYDFATVFPRAQKQFWHHSLIALCKEMEAHITASRQALSKAKIYKSNSALHLMLAQQEASVTEALNSQEQAVDFLNAYRQEV